MNALATAGVRALEITFVSGGVGSVLVLLLSGIEDIHTLFEKHNELRDDSQD